MMLLVVVCMAVILLVYPPVPVSPATNNSGTTDTVPEVVPYIMGAAAVIWAAVSMLTQRLKMGLVPIQELNVRVRVLPEGMLLVNPDIWRVWESGQAQTRVLELTVEVLKQAVPCWKQRTSLLSWKTKFESMIRGRTTWRVTYWTVFIQNCMGAKGESPSALKTERVGVQLTVWQGMNSSLIQRGVMELQGSEQRDRAPDDISTGLYTLDIVSRKCLPTTSCSLNMTLIRLGLTTVVDWTAGGSPVTAMVVTREEAVNWKFPDMVKRKVERAVGEATPIVMSRRRVDTVIPGWLAFWALMETRLRRLLFLSSKNTCPMFQFSSSITPVPLIAYIQKLSLRAPMAGKLSCSSIWREQSVLASNAPLKPTTIVTVEAILGLRELTVVVFMVMGLGEVLLAVFRLWQESALRDS